MSQEPEPRTKHHELEPTCRIGKTRFIWRCEPGWPRSIRSGPPYVCRAGEVRPGILVEEAEAPFSQLPNDVFILRWLGMAADSDLPSTMVAEQCEVIYQSAAHKASGDSTAAEH